MEATEGTPSGSDSQTSESTSHEPSSAASSESTSHGSAQDTGSSSQVSGDSGTSSETGEVTPPPYSPNLKFKVRDKEYDFDKELHAGITSPEAEKKLRELYEKSYGLDLLIKPKFDETTKNYQSLQSEHKGVLSSIQALRNDYQRGDFDSFFEKLRIPEEKIYNWVINKAKYLELPPEQKAYVDAQKAAEQRARETETKYQSDVQRYEEQVRETRRYALDTAVQLPGVKEFAAQFDQARGPGAFREQVIKQGELAWYSSQGKVDLTPEQAIKATMDLFGGFLQSQPQQMGMTTATPGQQAQASTKEIPVIPNLAGRGTAPIKTDKPKLISDIRKKYKETFGA